MKARRTHSIKLGSSQSRKSSQKEKSKHTERDEQRNQEYLLSGVTVNIVSPGQKLSETMHFSSRQPSGSASGKDAGKEKKQIRSKTHDAASQKTETKTVDMMEGIEKFEITLEKYDAAKRMNAKFVEKFAMLDMVFNKVEAFKQATTVHRSSQFKTDE